jgi:hypothetical protein
VRAQRTIWALGLLGLLTTAGGCLTSTTGRLRTDDAPGALLAPVSPERVVVYPTADIGRPYEIVGLVIAASSTGDQPARTYALLQQEAASLGADAVVDARMEIDLGYWTYAAKISGIAVKLK